MREIQRKTYEEKRSKFIAILFEVEDEEDFKKTLEMIRTEHPKCRHVQRAGRFKNKFGVPVLTSSEDGEPVSSMRRLSSIIERRNLCGVAVFIVRYFGGTKLGASHLDRVFFDLGTSLLPK